MVCLLLIKFVLRNLNAYKIYNRIDSGKITTTNTLVGEAQNHLISIDYDTKNWFRVVQICLRKFLL